MLGEVRVRVNYKEDSIIPGVYHPKPERKRKKFLELGRGRLKVEGYLERSLLVKEWPGSR